MEKDEIIKIIKEEIRKVITQIDYLPDSIKQRHIGEGIRFIRAGLAANRPTSGEKAGATYFATDTNFLSIWNGSVWVEIELTS